MKKMRRRRVMPGFPVAEQFSSVDEMNAYFVGARIVCLRCGRKLRRLGGHLQPMHDMTEDEYRRIYGIPWSRGLCSTETAAKYGDASKRYVQDNLDTVAGRLGDARPKALATERRKSPRRSEQGVKNLGEHAANKGKTGAKLAARAKKGSPEHYAKQQAAWTKEARMAVSARFKGVPKSAEQREKMRQSAFESLARARVLERR